MVISAGNIDLAIIIQRRDGVLYQWFDTFASHVIEYIRIGPVNVTGIGIYRNNMHARDRQEDIPSTMSYQYGGDIAGLIANARALPHCLAGILVQSHHRCLCTTRRIEYLVVENERRLGRTEVVTFSLKDRKAVQFPFNHFLFDINTSDLAAAADNINTTIIDRWCGPGTRISLECRSIEDLPFQILDLQAKMYVQ